VRNTDGGDWATLVRNGRIAARLSQQVLADLIGVSRWSILRWEGGTQRPENAEVVARLAEVIRVDFDLLMRAAGLALAAPGTPGDPDPRLHGLDPNSPQVRHILSLNVDEDTRTFMLDRQREIDALRAKQDIAELDLMAKRERERRQSGDEPGSARRAS
jgi:transcriptional regulator with XRE-family HTH domain